MHPSALQPPLFPYTTLFRSTFLQVAVEQYKQIGVKITPKLEDFTALVPKLTGGSPEVEAVIIGWQLSADPDPRSEEHTSELQSLRHLVCRLLLEKKKQQNKN